MLVAGLACLLALVIGFSALFIHNSNRFAEPLIKQAALTSLGKAPSSSLTEEDYSAVKTLWIVGDQCYKDGATFYEKMPLWSDNGSVHSKLMSLEDLKRFPNLTEIGIAGAHISDPTPLAELPELVKVDFCDNYISDISPLGDVEKLYAAHLSNNPLLNASPLAEHPDICS